MGHAQSSTFGDWHEDSDTVLKSFCEVSGRKGAEDFKEQLQPGMWPLYQRWLDEAASTPLTAASRADGIDRFCLKGSQCALTANWYLSMHPAPRVRREAVFQAMRILAWRRQWRAPMKSWSDIRALAQDDDFDKISYSEAAKARSLLVERSILKLSSGRMAGLIDHMAKAPCAIARDPLTCAKMATKIFREVSAVHVGSDDLRLGYPIFKLILSTPEALGAITRDPRYGKVFQLVNLKLLNAITALETTDSSARPASSPMVGDMVSDLRQAIGEVFACQSEECIQAPLIRILEFYGGRGSSFLGLIDYFTGEQMPALGQYGLFATLINYVDVLIAKSHANDERLYTVTDHLFRSCPAAKPYHYFLPYALSLKMASGPGQDRSAAQALFFFGLAYQFTMRNTAEPKAALGEPNSVFYNLTRLDLIFNVQGAIRGLNLPYDLDPAAALAVMNRAGDPNKKTNSIDFVMPPVPQAKPSGSLWSKLVNTPAYVSWARKVGVFDLLRLLEGLSQ
jgi:hypothetical protein